MTVFLQLWGLGGKVFGTLNIVQLTCIYNVTLALPR